MNERLIDMESRIAFQEQAIRELSDQLAAQRLQIDKLERLTQTLSQHLRELASANPGAMAADEKPPHY